MLDIDEGGRPALLLSFGDDVQCEGGLAGGLGAEDLDDAATGHARAAKGEVEGEGAGGDAADDGGVVVEAHDGALAERALDLGDGPLEGRLAVLLHGIGHGRFPCR